VCGLRSAIDAGTYLPVAVPVNEHRLPHICCELNNLNQVQMQAYVRRLATVSPGTIPIEQSPPLLEASAIVYLAVNPASTSSGAPVT